MPYPLRGRLAGIPGAGLAFVAALLVRLAYQAQIQETPLTQILLIDSETYDRMARAILAGTFRGEEVYAMNPLYPYFLAAVYGLSGAGPGAVLVVQSVLDAGTAALVFAIGSRLFGSAAGILAGAGAALYGPLVFSAGALLTPTLITFLVTLSVFLLIRYREGGGPGTAIGAGALVGLASLGRGNNLLLVPLALAAFLTGTTDRRRAWMGWGIFAGAAVLVAGSLVVRNAVVEGELVPIAANYAAFYIGHNSQATGLYAMPDFVESARFEGEVLAARDTLSARVGRDMTLGETSRYLFGEGLRYAIGHPLQEMRLAAVKLYYALNRTESPTNLSYAFARDFSSLLRWLPLNLGWVAPLAAAGIVLSWRRRRELTALYAVLLVTFGTCVLFFVSAEYRLPAVPVLLVFAGYAMTEGWRAARVRSSRRPRATGGRSRNGEGRPARVWLAAGAVLVLVAIAGNMEDPRLRFQTLKRVDYLNFGTLYRDRGDLGRARDLLETSLRIDPRYAPAYAALATVADREGNEQEAARLAQMARRFRPAEETMGTPSAGIEDALLDVSALYRAGKYAEALRGFERLREEARGVGNPELGLALENNIGLCQYKLRDLPRAAATFEEILAVDSTYVKAMTNLGLVRLAQGRPEDARRSFERALALDPANATANREIRRLEATSSTD